MKNIRLLLAFFITILLICSCKNTDMSNNQFQDEILPSLAAETISSESIDFNSFMIGLVPKTLSASPLYASLKYENLESLYLDSLNEELDDISIDAIQVQQDSAASTLEVLEEINPEALTEEQQAAYEVLLFQNQLVLQGAPYEFYTPMIEPSSGLQISILLNLMQLEFHNTTDLDQYIHRLHELPNYLGQITAYEDARRTLGLLLPASLYSNVITQLNSLLASEEDFILYQDFCNDLTTMDFLTETQRSSYKQSCFSIVKDELFPAFRSLLTFVQGLEAEGVSRGNVCFYTDGKAYYQYILYKETSYSYTGNDFLTFLEEEIKKIHVEIETLYSNHPEWITEDLQKIIPTFTSMDELYALQSKCLTENFYDYGITPAKCYVIPPFLADYLAAGFYFPISIDGGGYGNMYLNESDINSPSASTLELLFHEDLPGHHLYFSKFYQSDAPLIQKLSSWLPYEEGWAQYVQNMSLQYMGINKELTSLLQLVSRLSMFQLMELDLQYHYFGMSEDKILAAYKLCGYNENAALKAMQRMIAHPGEIIHYAFGEYKIEGYKHLCEDQLGDQFQIKDFHDIILKYGSVPFYKMDKIIIEYINSIS